MQIIRTLVAVAAFAGATAAQAMPSAIVFDGYCDGVSNIMMNANGTVTGTWSNNDCAGGSSPAIGQRANVSGTGMGQTGHYVADFALFILVRINDNGTWTYYDQDGNYFNSGTWSDASLTRAAPGNRSSLHP
ncbi:MAG: hypothetical protein LCH73_01650 [Proteobacteria bacterium]|nr:hypothetical protein [Pseudomonadota bacterium]